MTMAAKLTFRNPSALRPPNGYTYAVEIAQAERRLTISGQVGVAADGSIPDSAEGQIAQAFANLRAILDDSGMGIGNIVKTTVYLTDRAHLAAFRAGRAAALGDHAPASTLLISSGLADPRFVVEIEAEAVA